MSQVNVIAFIEAVKAEHRELAAQMHAIQALLDETPSAAELPAAVERAARSLDELCESLSRHFVQEEEGGFLEEALVHAPQLSGEARQLMGEHPELKKTAAEAAARVRNCKTAADWQAVAAKTRQLLKRLRQHEAGETRVLFAGFNIDPEIIG